MSEGTFRVELPVPSERAVEVIERFVAGDTGVFRPAIAVGLEGRLGNSGFVQGRFGRFPLQGGPGAGGPDVWGVIAIDPKTVERPSQSDDRRSVRMVDDLSTARCVITVVTLGDPSLRETDLTLAAQHIAEALGSLVYVNAPRVARVQFRLTDPAATDLPGRVTDALAELEITDVHAGAGGAWVAHTCDRESAEALVARLRAMTEVNVAFIKPNDLRGERRPGDHTL